MNLVGNAVKFTERGEVAVTLTCLPHPINGPTTASNERSATMRTLQITVRDTGIGMSAEHRKNLFQVFMQADSSTTRRYGGTGLGLAITQRLVDLLGGQIVVESQLGVGSKFTVTIPYQCSATQAATLGQSATMPPLGACLFVSNNRALYQEVAGYLATWSIQTEQYTQPTGGNAQLLFYLRQVAASGKPLPAIMLDQQSVAVEPLTLARSVRADPSLGKAVLVLIAPKLLPPLHQQLLAAGFDGVTMLPVTQSAIYNLLTALIQQEAESSVQTDLAQPTPEGTVQAATTTEKQRLVLVAEDYVNNQRVALAYLKKLGYAAHVVENGAAAVDAIINSGERYQAVLMDWQMPIMDGLEATRKIRAWETVHGQHTPIIGMTANAIKGARESCLAAGMDDYLSKPVKRDELQALLTVWVPVA
jgi:CheY-like chemotaxis protein